MLVSDELIYVFEVENIVQNLQLIWLAYIWQLPLPSSILICERNVNDLRSMHRSVLTTL